MRCVELRGGLMSVVADEERYKIQERKVETLQQCQLRRKDEGRETREGTEVGK
jgi:hypothetical protein